MSTPMPETHMPQMSPTQRSLVRKVLFFDAMLTPTIITFVYWMMLAVLVIAGLIAMKQIPHVGFLAGLMIIAVGAVGARIWCELLIVLFKINEHTRKMAERP